ncbi:hypothetical protein ACHAXA_008586 [Cyclostephanos tholiformis]|uniref:SET domain-containing protein n=1 Tax=Cyclostephanos tholiformis TaxID=382380 RepID=A0ABD3SQ89_9STRA
MVATRAGASSIHPNTTTQPPAMRQGVNSHPNKTKTAAARAKETPKSSTHGFCVPYEIRPSTIAGRGVFALEPIKRGTLVWEYAIGRSVVEYRNESDLRTRLDGATRQEARDVLEHIYIWKDAAVEIIDDAKIWNHTPNPNTGYHPDDPDIGGGLGSYALRDIAAGEELTDDYGDHHELAWFEGLCKEFGATSCTDLGRKIR